MTPETVQLAAESGMRCCATFWGLDIAFELFLAGLAGGLMILPRAAQTRRWAFAALALAGLVLFLHLGQKSAALWFYASFQPQAPMWWGAWLFALALAALLLWDRRPSLDWLRVPVALLGAGLVLYPGIMLGSLAARPAWHPVWTPVSFTILSLGSAAALLVLLDPRLRLRRAWSASAALVLLVTLATRAAILLSGQG